MDDVTALNQLAYRYAAAVDACDTSLFQSVFHAEARLHGYYPDSDGPFVDLRGHEQLAAVPNAMRGVYKHTTHMMTNHMVEIDGDTAKGQVLCTARHLTKAPDPGSINIIIRYVDRYARQITGWVITERQIRFLWAERHETADPAALISGRPS